MSDIIIGTEAVASGRLTSYELRRGYRPIFPNVHTPRDRPLTIADRAVGAWLWTRRNGVVTGLAAAALHGSRWIDDDSDVEVIFDCTRPPRGIIARNDRIAPDEQGVITGVAVANPARTAFDLGRFRGRYDAVARLDALMQARPYSIEEVVLLTKRYRGARGVALLKAALPLVDPRAESPRETFWRLLVQDSGFPMPATQIPVVDEDGRAVRILDFGWEKFKVALEYDGAQHQSDRAQYLKDRRVMPVLGRLGWIVIGVVKEDQPVEVLQRLHQAMSIRGFRGKVQIPAYAYRRWA